MNAGGTPALPAKNNGFELEMELETLQNHAQIFDYNIDDLTGAVSVKNIFIINSYNKIRPGLVVYISLFFR